MQKVLDSDFCTGCGLCSSVFPSKVDIGVNKDGFYRPIIKEKLDKRELSIFRQFCPGVKVLSFNHEAPFRNKIWGTYFSVITGKSSNKSVLDVASSGGAITSILLYLIENKTVDYVIQIGVSEDNPLLSKVFVTNDPETLINNANSRYTPSAPLVDILNLIDSSKKYAFVGKPCDISALKSYALIDPVCSPIKIYLSFFCAGVPSYNSTISLLESFSSRIDFVKNIRYRDGSWPGNFKVEETSGKVHEVSYNQSWKNFFGPTVQTRCKICGDSIGHNSDLVCADAWSSSGKDGFPTEEIKTGTSLVISRSKIGETVLREVLNNKALTVINPTYDINDLQFIQPGQYAKKQYVLIRLIALFILFKRPPSFPLQFLLFGLLKSKFSVAIRNFLGVFRRVFIKGKL